MRHDVMGDRRVGWNAILGIVLICLGVGMPALAATSQAPERWAAISLVGDRMNLIYARSATGTTGSSTNPNRIEAVATRSDVLDRLVLRAVLDTTVPGNPEIVALALNNPALYQAQDKLFAAEGRALLESLRKALEPQQVTHLLAIVSAHGEAAFPAEGGNVGMGSVEGLGFYIDKMTRTKSADIGLSDRGYLAPFAYYRVILYDFARNAIVADERVTASMLHPIAGTAESDPWELVSAQQKFDDIATLLQRNMGAALVKLAVSRTAR